MTGLSEQQIAEIQARVLNATPGPWELYEDYGKNFYANVRGEMLLPVGSIEFGDGDTADADRALVEHAAEDLALLLAEVEQLTALLETRARFAELAERRYEFVARFGQRKIKEAEGRREYGKQLEARVAELEAERHSTNEALSDAAEALRDANTAAGLVAEYHVPAADGQWLAVRREPNGDRWALYTAGRVLGDRKTWTGELWLSIALATDSELWNYASADTALAEATRLAEAGDLS